MSDWVLVPALADLRTQLNAIAPGRDKSSDGTIGDQSHASGTSSHNPDRSGRPEHRDGDSVNEVRAVDLDKDLRTEGLTMDMVVRHLVAGAKSGRFWWLRYIIWNRTIWAKTRDWAPRAYTGANPHDQHAHINSDFTQAADKVSGVNYRLGDIPVALTAADKNWIKTQVDEAAERAAVSAAQKVWATRLDVNIDPKQKPSLQPAGSILRYLSPEGHKTRDMITALAGKVTELAGKVTGK